MKIILDLILKEILSLILSFKKQSSTIKNNYLIIHDAGIGDFLLLLPILKTMIDKGSHFSIITNNKNLQIAQNLVIFENVFSINLINNQEFNEVLIRYPNVISIRSDTKIIVRLLYNIFNINSFVPNPLYESIRLPSRFMSYFSKDFKKKYYSNYHMAEIYEHMLFGSRIQEANRRLNISDYLITPYPSLPDQLRSFLLHKNPRPFVIVNVGGSDKIRKLDPSMIKKLLNSPFKFILVGDSKDISHYKDIVGPNCFNAVGELSIFQLFNLILNNKCILIVPDSMLMHFCSTHNIPCIGLMGNALVETYGFRTKTKQQIIISRNPDCSPCSLESCDVYNGHSCVQDITEYEILEHLYLILQI